MKTAPDLALLFLNALPFDGRMWDQQIGILPDHSFAPNLYAFGDDIQDWAARCLALVPQRRLVVVGCSVGGSCALEVINLAPERVAAAVLIGTKARHDPNPKALTQACKTVEQHGVVGAWKRYWASHFDTATDATIRRKAKEIALAQTPNALTNGLKAFHTRPSRETTVSHSTMPMHIVTGDADTLPGPEYARRLAALSATALLHVFEGCGHYIPMMQPTRLNALIKDVILRCE